MAPMKHPAPLPLALPLLILLLLLAGCDRTPAEVAAHLPITVTADDRCHVCGMAILGFPGPKGQAYTDEDEPPLKFCSISGMMAYLLQPGVGAQIREAYVHDMGTNDWEHPTDNSYIDARSAWYVSGHPLSGAMGPTLATFRNREDAERFAEKYGARVLAFDEITLDILKQLH